MEQRNFRRPAILTPQAADEIIGADDPAERSEVAHESAWALLGVMSETIDLDAIERLRQTIAAEGPEAIASLWDRSPAFTLPGALWRIYLLWQWNETNPLVVEQRFSEGVQALGLEGQSVVRLGDTLLAIEAVLTGHATDDQLAAVLGTTAQAMRIMAASVTHGPRWITDPTSELAHPVTRRPQALIETAAELEEGSRRAQVGRLD